MKDSLQAGLETTRRVQIGADRCIDFMGEDCRVYGTNWLVYDIEMTGRNLLLEHLDAGEDSVGTRVDVAHLAATPEGMWVEVTVKLVELEGRAARFEIECRDALDTVAKGRHERFVIDTAAIAKRIRDKKARGG